MEDIYGHNTKTVKTDLYSNVLSQKGFRPSIASETCYTPVEMEAKRSEILSDMPF